MTTDASKISVAAALSQVQEGADHPIAFFSRSLNDAECRWGSSESDLGAIVAGLSHFRQYLIGAKFDIFTDNAACVNILKKPNLSTKLHRWAVMIQDYDFKIHYKEGKLNYVCDALSRVEQVNTVSQLIGPDDVKLSQRSRGAG